MIPLLSVIVPVYETPEDLLRAALASVLGSSVKSLEVICVDDSPGARSSDVLREIAARDGRVKILTNECNRGVSYSRNRGLALARGEFLAFHDADDQVEPEGYARAIAFMRESGAQAVRAAHWEGKGEHFGVPFGGVVCVSTETGPEASLRRVVAWFGWTVWGGVYRRAALEGIRFCEAVNHYEDSLFNAELMAAVRCMGCLNVPFYHVVSHPNSLSRRLPGAREYLEYAHVAKMLVGVVERLRRGRHPCLAHYFSARCFHVLFSDRRVRQALVRCRERRAFCAVSRLAASRLAPLAPWPLPLALMAVRLCPGVLFWPGGLLLGWIKWSLRRWNG